MTVGLVLVSHSAKLAEGLVELTAQMAPDVTVIPAGGMPDGGIGTDYDSVLAAIERADSGDGVVLLYDLGSAQMTAELAVESTDKPASLVDAPLVEGAVAASVAAQGGADRSAVAASAASAGGQPTAAAPEQPASADGESATAELTLTNDVGLHARPAALVARTVADLDAEVRIRLGDEQADARSVLALMALGARKDDRITVEATGPQAADAIQRIESLIARNFDE